MLSASSSLITRFGIVLCEVFSAALSAVAVIPGMFAIFANLAPSHLSSGHSPLLLGDIRRISHGRSPTLVPHYQSERRVQWRLLSLK